MKETIILSQCEDCKKCRGGDSESHKRKGGKKYLEYAAFVRATTSGDLSIIGAAGDSADMNTVPTGITESRASLQ
jgi:hypothetical protein